MPPAACAASARPRGDPLSPNTGPREVRAIPGDHPLRWKARESDRSMLPCSPCSGRKVRAG
eukprot:9123064-Alexandrium_andersonii.AAC.1